MNKNLFRVFSFISIFFVSSCIYAVDMKIGILDIAALEDSAAQYKDLKTKLETEFKPKQIKLNEKRKTLEEKHQGLQRDKDILSVKELTTKERELNRLQQDFQLLAEEFQVDYRNRSQESFMKWQKVLDEAVSLVAKREKYDLILPDQVALFNKDKKTFTNLVLKELDKKRKSSGSK